MKLNADIVFDNMKKYIPAEMFGYKTKELNLSRPEFYIDENMPFKDGHLYIITGNQVMRRASIEKGAVIISIGDVPQISYFNERCCFIKLKSNTSVFEVFNIVNSIFNKYSLWREKLSKTLKDSIDIDELVGYAHEIFENPILVLDSKFKVISATGYEKWGSDTISFNAEQQRELSMSALEQYLGEQELLIDVKEPLFLNMLGSSTLSLNLFDTDEYVGSITIDYKNSTVKAGHEALLKYFAQFLLYAIKKNSRVLISDRSMLRKLFSDIINDLPIATSRRKYLDNIEKPKRYICVIVKLNNRFAQIPIEYVCSKFEQIFPKGITFENRSNVISFIEVDFLKEGQYLREIISDQMQLLVGAMDITVGISNDFTDPYSAKLYYSQAQAALENGNLLDPEKKYYHFKDYALTELIINSQNGLPIEMYFPEGLIRLFEHDKVSPISYVETLECLLKNNMSFAATSSELFIHRSTLLERISRISRELGEDLKNPDVRLKIQWILKAIEINKSIMDKPKS